MNRVTSWLDSESVRTISYPILVAVVGYLATRGIVDHDTVNLILAVCAAVFGWAVPETMRAQVFSRETVRALTSTPLDPQPKGWDPDAPTGRHAD